MKLLKIAAGILFLILNLGIWINGTLFNIRRGMDTLFAVPLLFTGAFLLLGWYKSAGAVPATKPQKWKFIMRVLLINYAVLYLVYMISDLIYHDAINFLSTPGIILPVLLGLFITGFLLSWKHELYAGILFLLWYFLVLYGSFKYVEIMSRGPHMQFGIVIFIHGILYIYYHFRIKSANEL